MPTSIDYFIITGVISVIELYKKLYQFKDKNLIFSRSLQTHFQ